MRTILVSVLLIVAVLAIYQATIGGDKGMRADAESRGQGIARTIEAIDP